MKPKFQHYIEFALVAAALGFAVKCYYNSSSKEKQIKKLTKEKNDLSFTISNYQNMIKERDQKIVSLQGELREQKENHEQQLEKNQKQFQESIKNIIQDIKNCIVVDLNFQLKQSIEEALKNFCEKQLQEEKIINDYIRRIK